MSSSFCAACGAQLTSGARFCHRCGQTVGDPVFAPGAAPSGAAPARLQAPNQTLPWAVAAIALLAFIALLAGQRFNRGPTAAAVPERTADIPPAGPFAGGAPAGAPDAEQAVRAPDISNMTPDERALRLFNRVVSLAEQGKRDSVQFFAPMALMSFQSLPTPTLLQRFELGRIAELADVKEIATAQADTILQSSPTHLLGLSLASTAARMRGDAKAQADYDKRLIAAAAAERAKNLQEYQVTQIDLDSALARARRNAK